MASRKTRPTPEPTELTLPDVVEGELRVNASDRIALVAGRFNSFITEQLVAGALDTLVRSGADPEHLMVVKVPGAWEIPLTVARLAQSPRIDAVIALGAVIRGGTPHFDYVAGEVAKGVAVAALAAKKPVSFGVLTTDSIEQAIERAGTKAGNKGAEAALAVIEMLGVERALKRAGL